VGLVSVSRTVPVASINDNRPRRTPDAPLDLRSSPENRRDTGKVPELEIERVSELGMALESLARLRTRTVSEKTPPTTPSLCESVGPDTETLPDQTSASYRPSALSSVEVQTPGPVKE